MPISRKTLRAREPYECEFCRGQINKNEKYVRTVVQDRFGRYKLRRHKHCEHTAQLNKIAQRVDFDV